MIQQFRKILFSQNTFLFPRLIAIDQVILRLMTDWLMLKKRNGNHIQKLQKVAVAKFLVCRGNCIIILRIDWPNPLSEAITMHFFSGNAESSGPP